MDFYSVSILQFSALKVYKIQKVVVYKKKTRKFRYILGFIGEVENEYMGHLGSFECGLRRIFLQPKKTKF